MPDAPHARDHFHAAVIDGALFAAAGRRSSHDTGQGMELTVAEVDRFDFETGWSTLKNVLPTPRAGAATVVVGDGLIVIGGESSTQRAAHSEAERLDVSTGEWAPLPAMPQGRHGAQAAVLDDTVHIVSGSANRGGGPELADHLALSPVP